jgi:general secretion pathway protein M
VENYKQKWQQLNAREKSLILIMSVVIGIFIFYMLIWQPLNNNLIKAEKKQSRQQALLQLVQEKTKLYQQSKHLSNRNSGSLTGVINRTARQHKIKVTRMQPQGDNLQVWVDEVPFEQLLHWLAQLVNNEGITINAIDISKTDTNGVVQVRRLQLGRN